MDTAHFVLGKRLRVEQIVTVRPYLTTADGSCVEALMNVFVPVADIVTLEQDDCVERVKASEGWRSSTNMRWGSVTSRRVMSRKMK